MSIIELKGVTKEYGQHTLSKPQTNLISDWKRGQFVVIISHQAQVNNPSDLLGHLQTPQKDRF